MFGYSWELLKKQIDELDINEERLRCSDVVLFGAGFRGELSYERLKEKYNVKAFTDNDNKKWGQEIHGLPILPPDKIKGFNSPFVIITVGGHLHNAIKNQLKEMGIPYISYMELLLKIHLPKFETVYINLFEDEFSKRTYLALLLGYLTGDMENIRDVSVRDTYFILPEMDFGIGGDVFVDCGAYVGDTMERFIHRKTGLFRKIYAFEPTKISYQALNFRKQRLLNEWALAENSIVTEQKLVGTIGNTVRFKEKKGELTGSHIVRDSFSDGKDHSADVVSLDKYFAEEKELPTFIKADVEGAEMELIDGAISLITNNKPLLAVCVYHRDEDLYEIPLRLKQLNPEYKMMLRHHRTDFFDTVLYCH